MSEITWQDPPAPTSGRGSSAKHEAIAAQLKNRPGQWALVTTGTNVTAYQIREGRLLAYAPAGTFEAVYRKRPDGRFDVYARYVGTESGS